MEVEAWLLGLNKVFSKIDGRLTNEFIEENLKFNLADVDPEKAFFHPAKEVGAILGLVERNYNKSKGDINAFVSYLAKEDYLELLRSDKCDSFKEFIQSLHLSQTAIT